MFRFRSVKSIVIAPARTGNARRSIITVMKTAHRNRGSRSIWNPFPRMFIIVVMKFRAPRIDLAPAKCNEKIARSTDGPAWAIGPASGGYTVHPAPTPFSTAAEATRSVRAGGRSQNLILLRRGNAMSGHPSISGINQFPNPPINTGITRKKIIRKAWAVTKTLYKWSLPSRAPG